MSAARLTRSGVGQGSGLRSPERRPPIALCIASPRSLHARLAALCSPERVERARSSRQIAAPKADSPRLTQRPPPVSVPATPGCMSRLADLDADTRCLLRVKGIEAELTASACIDAVELVATLPARLKHEFSRGHCLQPSLRAPQQLGVSRNRHARRRFHDAAYGRRSHELRSSELLLTEVTHRLDPARR